MLISSNATHALCHARCNNAQDCHTLIGLQSDGIPGSRPQGGGGTAPPAGNTLYDTAAQNNATYDTAAR